MRRTFTMLLVLFFIYLSLQVIDKFISSGHIMEYNITSEDRVFNVKEKYINKKKQSNYLFEVKTDKNTFYFQTYHNFNKADTIIKDIKYTEFGSYKCLLPIFFGNKTVLDITCFDGKLIYNYADLAGKNRDLDNWVNSLSSVYTVSKFKDDFTNTQELDKTIIYPANVLSNHFVSVENYRGVHTVNKVNVKKIANVQVFEKDQYSRPVSGYSEKYYITADYTDKDKIKRFFIVNVTNNEKISIEATKEISFDSYIMGGVDGSFYLYDRKAKKQYQINIKTKKIIEVGNKEVGLKFYSDEKWTWVELQDVQKDIMFNQVYLGNEEYARIDNIMGENGYTYYYAKNGQKYDVFVAPSRYTDFKQYVFSVDNLDTIIYLNDYVYFQNGDTIYYYHNGSGLRAVYKDSELKFNEALKFGVYINK